MKIRDITSMAFNILIKKEDEMWMAHCLELDIVSVAETKEAVVAELKDLIIAQIEYAFQNDNLDNLYKAAPASVWKEFYSCEAQEEERVTVQSDPEVDSFVPPWIIARMCSTEGACFA